LCLRLRPHYTGGVWKRRFYTVNASTVFRPHLAGGTLKTQQSPVILYYLCLRKLARIVRRKRKPGVFKFLLSQERFRKAPFSWRTSVYSRPNRRNKAAFSNFSSLEWTLPEAPSWRYAGGWNVALFLRLGLLSLVTRHENGGFWKGFWNFAF